METKICTKCGRELSVDMFHKKSTSKDGLQHYCKDCTNDASKKPTTKGR